MLAENWYQELVASTLEESLGLARWRWWREVSTLDGSRIDLVHCHRSRVIGFELKQAEPGEVTFPVDSRASRQLRHFAAAVDALYLVTLAVPRSWRLDTDGRVYPEPPLEGQLLPAGVGWIVVDRMTIEAAVLVPAAELQSDPAHRGFLLDQLAARETGRVRAVTMARAGA